VSGPDFRDLVGDDMSPEELAELERVDRLLRSVPPPPSEVPGTLTRSVEHIGTERRLWTPRRFGAVAALAAALAAVFFGVGRWTDTSGTHYRLTIPLRATTHAPNASALIKVADRDEATGNWELQLRVSGLPRLSAGEYYVLWLAKNGKYAATCGTFNVGRGTTTVDMTVSYRLGDYDSWVISSHREDAPWLLSARIRT
jgi:anti-sigma-K factor RskA